MDSPFLLTGSLMQHSLAFQEGYHSSCARQLLPRQFSRARAKVNQDRTSFSKKCCWLLCINHKTPLPYSLVHTFYESITMVCPYRLVTGMITAALSILYVSKTLAEPMEECTEKSTQTEKSVAKPQSSTRRMFIITLLVLFHIDLFTTGYVRMGAKHLLQSSSLWMG